jgi:hypothetical protein
MKDEDGIKQEYGAGSVKADSRGNSTIVEVQALYCRAYRGKAHILEPGEDQETSGCEYCAKPLFPRSAFIGATSAEPIELDTPRKSLISPYKTKAISLQGDLPERSLVLSEDSVRPFQSSLQPGTKGKIEGEKYRSDSFDIRRTSSTRANAEMILRGEATTKDRSRRVIHGKKSLTKDSQWNLEIECCRLKGVDEDYVVKYYAMDCVGKHSNPLSFLANFL